MDARCLCSLRNASAGRLRQLPINWRHARRANSGARRRRYTQPRSRGGPQAWQLVYARACLDCHNTNGSGIARSPQALSLGYAVPPLWGADSFNDWRRHGKLITLAISFIPTCRMGPIIGTRCVDEEALGCGGLVELQARPH